MLIKKASDGTETSVNLTPVYKLSSVSFQKSGEIGYIRVKAFYDDTAKEFKDAVDKLISEGISGMIVDVRNNKSFNYEYAANVIDVIVPLATEGNGAIATALDYAGKSIAVFPADAQSINVPLSVLINDRTEGAAELLAADLRDFSNAILVGENTAGNASYQKEFSFDSGDMIILTAAKICPYISECYDGQGIAPDITVTTSDYQKDILDTSDVFADEQYKAAVTALS